MQSMRHHCNRLGARIFLAAALTVCAEGCVAAEDDPVLRSSYMPEWSDTDFRELASCYQGVFPSRQAFEAAVLGARRHDRRALEQVLECSYGRGCDGAASELYGGEL